MEQKGYITLNLYRNDKRTDDAILKSDEIKEKIMHRIMSLDYADTDSIRITDILNRNGININFQVDNELSVKPYGHDGEYDDYEGFIDTDDICADIQAICNELLIYIDECEVEDSYLEEMDDIAARSYKEKLDDEKDYGDRVCHEERNGDYDDLC